MVYSDVIKAGLILPKKDKYTLADVAAVVNNSLFNPFENKTLSTKEACFVVICSAIYHNTNYSMNVVKLRNKVMTKII